MLVWIILVIIAVGCYMLFARIVMPMWRFMTRKDDVFSLYDIMYEYLLEEYTWEEEIRIKALKFNLSFSNTKEISIKLENCINVTLEYYDKLGWIVNAVEEFQFDKDKLYRMRTEIRRLRLTYKN